MIRCGKCGKENQDHYKFCLGCGSELPRPLGKGIADEQTSLGQGGSAPPPPGDAAPLICPQCSHANPSPNRFCAACGFKLGRSAAPAALAKGAAAPPTAAATPSAAAGGGPLLTALRADGTESGEHQLPAEEIMIGRDTGGIFAGDSYLSPKHATFIPGSNTLRIRDEQSLNGVYRKLHRDEPQPLGFGDIFRIGQEILKVEPLKPLDPSSDGVERLGSPAKGYVGRLALVIGRDATGNAYPIPESGLHLGRERGDVLFPEDGYVSGLHCHVSWQEGKLFVTDLGSSNGSFVRLLDETELNHGDVLLMGQQLFRVSLPGA